jgi:hypothetical protein
MNILFVDDTRTFPDHPEDCVVTVRTAAEAIVELRMPKVQWDEIWLDFDLGGVYGQMELYDTAMPVALWLAEQAFYGCSYKVKQIMIHTGNPVGRHAMGLLLRRFGYEVIDVEPSFG